MEVIAASCIVTAVLFGVFFLIYRTNKTSLMSGFTFGMFLFALVATYTIAVGQHPANPFLLYPLIALAGIALIVPLFGIYILVGLSLIHI